MIISSDAHLVKLTSEGEVSWVKELYTKDPGNIFKAKDCCVISGIWEGVVSDTERIYPEMSGYAQNGNYLWSYIVSDTTKYPKGVRAFQTKDNEYVLAGHGSSGYFIAKTDPSRNLIWKNFFEMAASNLHYCKPTRDGGYILVGSANIYGAAAIKLNSVGEVQWQDDFNVTAIRLNPPSFRRAAFSQQYVYFEA